MLGFAASLLAVCCQILLLATISLAPLAIAADPLGNVPICHAEDAGQPAQHAPTQPAHDCALCAICLAHSVAVAILSPTPAVPERQFVATMRLGSLQPRAPPVLLRAAAQPRGPPSLI